MTETATQPAKDDARPPRIVWGADKIATVLGLPDRRRVFHMLASGSIPGAAKVGERWCLNVDQFMRQTFGEGAR